MVSTPQPILYVSCLASAATITILFHFPIIYMMTDCCVNEMKHTYSKGSMGMRDSGRMSTDIIHGPGTRKI